MIKSIIFLFITLSQTAGATWGLSEGFMLFGKKTLFRSTTIFFHYDGEYTDLHGLTEIIWQAAMEINQELDLLAVSVNPGGNNDCRRGDDLNEICFDVPQSDFNFVMGGEPFDTNDYGGLCQTRARGYLTIPGKKSSKYAYHEGDPEPIAIGEIFEADIWVADDIPKAFMLANIKHEMLHSLGFGHIEYGIMNPVAGSRGLEIDYKQLKAWKKFINKMGGFNEKIPVVWLN